MEKDYRKKIINGLNKALADELSAASVYACMAEKTKNAKLAEELLAHSQEEFGHYRQLISFIFNHGLDKDVTFTVDSKVINNVTNSTDEILKTVQGLETTAISDYKSLALCAREANDLEAEEFFISLMKDEMGHFDDLAQYTGEKRSLGSVLAKINKKDK